MTAYSPFHTLNFTPYHTPKHLYTPYLHLKYHSSHRYSSCIVVKTQQEISTARGVWLKIHTHHANKHSGLSGKNEIAYGSLPIQTELIGTANPPAEQSARAAATALNTFGQYTATEWMSKQLDTIQNGLKVGMSDANSIFRDICRSLIPVLQLRFLAKNQR